MVKTIVALFSIILAVVLFTSAQASAVQPMTCSNVDQAMYCNTQVKVYHDTGNLKGAKKDSDNAEVCTTAAAPHSLKEQKLAKLNNDLTVVVRIEEIGAVIASVIIVLTFLTAILSVAI